MLRVSRRLAAALGVLMLCAGRAHAQPVERHLPPRSEPPPAALAPPAEPEAAADDRPLGPKLAAIVVLGPQTPQPAAPAARGVDVMATPRLDTPVARAVLASFLGRPLSRKLIVEVETAIVREYRRQGFPFVTVVTPPQEVTNGTLQLRVVEYQLGKLSVAGTSPAIVARVAHAIRLQPGDPIATRRLAQDLDWLARYPFRTYTPAFAPGAAAGTTDLTLDVAAAKPWRVFAGYDTSDSSATGQDRYFAGVLVGGLLLPDTTFSLQVTGSPDFWVHDQQLFHQRHPLYESLAGHLDIPLAPRRTLEISVDTVETNQPVDAFVVRQQTVEAQVDVRASLSDALPLPGDVEVGLEARRQMRGLLFSDIDVFDTAAETYQIYGAWSARWADRLGAGGVRAAVHVSPGGVNQRNSDERLGEFSGGRVTGARYVYAALNVARDTRLGAYLNLATELSAQYAGRALPDTEQFALGGQARVRGYSLDDGAFDDGLVLRDTVRLRLDHTLIPSAIGRRVTPLFFVDTGWGRDENSGANVRASSFGAGVDLRPGGAVSATFLAGRALQSAGVTRVGDWRVDATVTVSY